MYSRIYPYIKQRTNAVRFSHINFTLSMYSNEMLLYLNGATFTFIMGELRWYYWSLLYNLY